MDIFKQKTAAEQIRENKRMIDRAIREIDRERTRIEQQEKKHVMEMKKLAKIGQKVHPKRKPFLLYLCFFLGCVQNDGQGHCSHATQRHQLLQGPHPTQQPQHANDRNLYLLYIFIYYMSVYLCSRCKASIQ